MLLFCFVHAFDCVNWPHLCGHPADILMHILALYNMVVLSMHVIVSKFRDDFRSHFCSSAPPTTTCGSCAGKGLGRVSSPRDLPLSLRALAGRRPLLPSFVVLLFFSQFSVLLTIAFDSLFVLLSLTAVVGHVDAYPRPRPPRPGLCARRPPLRARLRDRHGHVVQHE